MELFILALIIIVAFLIGYFVKGKISHPNRVGNLIHIEQDGEHLYFLEFNNKELIDLVYKMDTIELKVRSQ